MRIISKYTDFYDYLNYGLNKDIVLKRQFGCFKGKITSELAELLRLNTDDIRVYFKDPAILTYLNSYPAKDELTKKAVGLLKSFVSGEREPTVGMPLKLFNLVCIGRNVYPTFGFMKKDLNREEDFGRVLFTFPVSLCDFDEAQVEEAVGEVSDDLDFEKRYYAIGLPQIELLSKQKKQLKESREPLLLITANCGEYSNCGLKSWYGFSAKRSHFEVGFSPDTDYVFKIGFCFSYVNFVDKQFIKTLKDKANVIYFDLQTFLSKEKEVPELSNMEKIVKAGFDLKESFRKRGNYVKNS